MLKWKKNEKCTTSTSLFSHEFFPCWMQGSGNNGSGAKKETQAGLRETLYHVSVNQPLKLASLHHQFTYVQVHFEACLTKVVISHFFPLPLDHNLRSIVQDCLILSHVHISRRTLKPDLYTQDNKYLWVTYKVVTHSHSSAENKGWTATENLQLLPNMRGIIIIFLC